MPRIHIPAYDLDTIEDMEEQEDWEAVIGRTAPDARRDGRSADTRGERRFGGADSLARKRADRRKNVSRPQRRV